MAQQYAKDQPQGYKNYVENIAVVGAGGQMGGYIVKHLLETGKHNITAITRADSSSKMPEGVKVAKVDYNNRASLVEALRGHDALIITLGVMAPEETQSKLIEAAIEADVPWIMPNDWGTDSTNVSLATDTMLGGSRWKARDLIEGGGKGRISICCGFWYEYSLAGASVRYGFDFHNRSVTFYDDGTTKINTSTWDQCGRAVAKLFSLKVLPEDAGDKSVTLSQFKDQFVSISSFLVSQKDMFDSVLRVTGTTEKDWNIKYEDVHERYKNGVSELQSGNRDGYPKLLYARVFFRDGGGDFESKKGLSNDVLGLPKEDIDERTRAAIAMAEEGSRMTRSTA
ncbi:hypothetical protein PV05_09021 [Exophiala xenobiotica]|uniref:NmrA-like domain-containing protein n=1 Tax=Exophiala xenobiotica TaxID=348802 RepID=A0A0D2CTT7_9EURO|nr:uncharacterized protein PV05_09021 [Exophiala xenobiotica]KIW53447.1 hypothetical protein PV05_09021 [Exophiala xenobiotica]